MSSKNLTPLSQEQFALSMSPGHSNFLYSENVNGDVKLKWEPMLVKFFFFNKVSEPAAFVPLDGAELLWKSMCLLSVHS